VMPIEERLSDEEGLRETIRRVLHGI